MSIDTTLTIAEFYAANHVDGHAEVVTLLSHDDGTPALWIENHDGKHYVGDDNMTPEFDMGGENAAEVARDWLNSFE